MSTKYEYLSEQAGRRMRGGEMILKGFDDEEIIEALAASPSSVKRWRAKLNLTNDLQILVRKEGTGRTPLLSEEQSEQLKTIIAAGAVAAGHGEERWTSRIIAKLIKERFGVNYAPRSVRAWMKHHGFTYQKPTVRPNKHSDDKVERWRRNVWPRIKKNSRNSASP
jgi:transposase